MLDYIKNYFNFHFSKGLKLTRLKLNFFKKYSPLQVKNKSSKKTEGMRERQRTKRKRKKKLIVEFTLKIRRRHVSPWEEAPVETILETPRKTSN
jgi:hypothetical protein